MEPNVEVLHVSADDKVSGSCSVHGHADPQHQALFQTSCVWSGNVTSATREGCLC